jgi:hypothetical protein
MDQELLKEQLQLNPVCLRVQLTASSRLQQVLPPVFQGRGEYLKPKHQMQFMHSTLALFLHLHRIQLSQALCMELHHVYHTLHLDLQLQLNHFRNILNKTAFFVHPNQSTRDTSYQEAAKSWSPITPTSGHMKQANLSQQVSPAPTRQTCPPPRPKEFKSVTSSQKMTRKKGFASSLRSSFI